MRMMRMGMGVKGIRVRTGRGMSMKRTRGMIHTRGMRRTPTTRSTK